MFVCFFVYWAYKSDWCARHNSLLINLRRILQTTTPSAQEKSHRYYQGTASWPRVGIEPTTFISAHWVGGKADLPLLSRPPGPLIYIWCKCRICLDLLLLFVFNSGNNREIHTHTNRNKRIQDKHWKSYFRILGIWKLVNPSKYPIWKCDLKTIFCLPYIG